MGKALERVLFRFARHTFASAFWSFVHALANAFRTARALASAMLPQKVRDQEPGVALVVSILAPFPIQQRAVIAGSHEAVKKQSQNYQRWRARLGSNLVAVNRG
jgi:hypothetical protein